MERQSQVMVHAFISYVREDSPQIDRLHRKLEEAGIPVWRDTSDLWPGEDWKANIRNAITDNSLVFIACYSQNSLARATSYQNEELTLAVEQVRLRCPEQPWLIPVRLDDVEIPDRDLGGGRMLSSIQRVDMFGDLFDAGAERLVTAIRRILRQPDAGRVDAESRDHDENIMRQDHEPDPSSAANSASVGGAGGRPADVHSPERASTGEANGFPLTADMSRSAPVQGRAFAERWRYTSDGFEATPLMNMASTAMPGHQGAQDQSPYLRVGVCVACDPISPDAGSSRIGSGFVRFLSRDPVAGLTSALTLVGDGMTWTRQAGHGALRLEAILAHANDVGQPTASAMLLPPISGMRMHGRADDVSCLWLHVEPRAENGTIAPPASLVTWHVRLRRAISLASAFVEFLTEDLGLGTHSDPAARVGVMLNAPRSMTELVDIGLLRVLPGAIASSQFLGYAIADPAGRPARDTAHAMLTNLCEYTLHLEDFEPVLAAL